MIVVIADDLTGAAELGGLGLKYGLHVEVATSVDFHSKADLLIISTDTRSMEKQRAVDEMIKVTSLVKKMKPAMIYKKVDSVLRGHVVDELTAQLKVLDLSRALLVPANPSLGRTIHNGTYFIHDQPVHLTAFSSDPEFPVVDSRVLNMLGGSTSFIRVKTVEEELPEAGIVVGEATTGSDLRTWASKAGIKNTLLAGGAGFFSAVLERMHLNKGLNTEGTETELGHPRLFVCGSTFDKSRQSIRDIKMRGGPVSYIPFSIIESTQPSENLYNEWCQEVVKLLSERGKAIIAIDKTTTETAKISAKDLRVKTATIVSQVIKSTHISELIVEGGSTASAIIRKLGFAKFFPVKEYAMGVVRMKVDGRENLYFTLKPGSYHWPNPIWNF